MTSSLVVNDKQFRDDLPDQIFFFLKHAGAAYNFIYNRGKYKGEGVNSQSPTHPKTQPDNLCNELYCRVVDRLVVTLQPFNLCIEIE